MQHYKSAQLIWLLKQQLSERIMLRVLALLEPWRLINTGIILLIRLRHTLFCLIKTRQLLCDDYFLFLVDVLQLLPYFYEFLLFLFHWLADVRETVYFLLPNSDFEH